jgi:hypothetical protein
MPCARARSVIASSGAAWDELVSDVPTHHIVRISRARASANGDRPVPVSLLGCGHAEEVGSAPAQRVRVVGIASKHSDSADVSEREYAGVLEKPKDVSDVTPKVNIHR